MKDVNDPRIDTGNISVLSDPNEKDGDHNSIESDQQVV